VIIPDFGGFVASYQSAQVNELQQTFYPPSKKIAFNAGLKNNDGLLANHLSIKERLVYSEAGKLILEYSKECLHTLDSGKKLNLDGIGLLFLDAEKNIQFLPDPNQNFLRGSFGLSMIHSAALESAETLDPIREIILSRKKKNSPKESIRTKFNWRILELVPAAAIVALMFTFPVLTKTFDSQLSNLNPFAEKSKTEIPPPSGKETAKQKLNPADVFYKPVVKNETAKNEVPTAENISRTLKDSVPTEEKSNVAASLPEEKKSSESLNTETSSTFSSKYHIIAGCFRIEENAVKLQSDLKSKGFNAEIIGKNDAGLTMVSASSFENLPAAKNSLEEIQTRLNSSAWIFKSK